MIYNSNNLYYGGMSKYDSDKLAGVYKGCLKKSVPIFIWTISHYVNLGEISQPPDLEGKN